VHRGVLLLLVLAAGSAPAAAQGASPRAPLHQGVSFLGRAAFNFSAEHISGTDPRFVWDAHFGGDVDAVDYGRGRTNVYASYEVILGEELHIFDPNQGSYVLGASSSVRAGGLELAGVFHHESRHLSDRPNLQPVDWNMVGVRVQRSATAGPVQTTVTSDLRGTIKTSYVDYRWEVDTRARTRYGLRSGIALVSDLGLRLLGVDGSRNRSTQSGYRVEGGARFEGAAAAIELFAAVERRIDPYPLQFGTATWGTVGLRLRGR
jgi:hypothetical protein